MALYTLCLVGSLFIYVTTAMPTTTCPPDTTSCQNDSTCISPAQICDGTPDCSDNSDEADCSGSEVVEVVSFNTTSLECSDGQFQCNSGDQCITIISRCDKVEDCRDGSDEIDCNECNGTDMFLCSNNKCIDKKLLCNGVDDCENEEDEKECQTAEKVACTSEEFSCSDGTCISNARVCDAKPDCHDEADEQNCPTTIKLMTTEEVPGGSSENTEDNNEAELTVRDQPSIERTQATCSVLKFTCGDGTCIDLHSVCDSKPDCNDSSDELYGCQIVCKDSFRCDDGACIVKEWVCDGGNDCRDGSDERNCKNTTAITTETTHKVRKIERDNTWGEIEREILFNLRQEHIWKSDLFETKRNEMQLRLETAETNLQAARLNKQAQEEILEHQEELYNLQKAKLGYKNDTGVTEISTV